MNRFNQSLLAAAVVAGLCGSVGFIQVGSSNNARAAERLEPRYPHMHLALEHLREARKQLEDAEDIFKGHKGEALEHVDHAINHIEAGFKEHGEAALPGHLPPADKLAEERFPHVHRALARLREARAELDSADKIFAGHREKAIEETDHAIHQLEEGIHNAER